MIIGYDIDRAKVAVAKICDVTVAEMMGNSKSRAATVARHLLAYVLRRDAGAKTSQLCRLFKLGQRTVIEGAHATAQRFASGVLSEAALDRALAETPPGPKAKGPPAIRSIRKAVAAHFGVEPASLEAQSRNANTTQARHVLMYLALKYSGRSAVDICGILKTTGPAFRFAVTNAERLAARGLINISELEAAVMALPPRIPATPIIKEVRNGQIVSA